MLTFSGLGTEGAPSLRTLQGRVECCRHKLYYACAALTSHYAHKLRSPPEPDPISTGTAPPLVPGWSTSFRYQMNRRPWSHKSKSYPIGLSCRCSSSQDRVRNLPWHMDRWPKFRDKRCNR